jgi:hypothetical protein
VAESFCTILLPPLHVQGLQERFHVAKEPIGGKDKRYEWVDISELEDFPTLELWHLFHTSNL